MSSNYLIDALTAVGYVLCGAMIGSCLPITVQGLKTFKQYITGKSKTTQKAYKRLLKLKEDLKDYETFNLVGYNDLKVYISLRTLKLVWYDVERNRQYLCIEFKDDTADLLDISSSIGTIDCYELISKAESKVRKDIDDANDLYTMLSTR